MINQPNQGPREIPYPLSRRLTFDVGRLGLQRHHVKALLEVDITDARRRIRERRRSGARCSFTAWFIKVVADTVARHPLVAGINDPRHNRVRLPDPVDIAVVIEKEVDGAHVPLPYVIRGADRKSLSEINEEIDRAKSADVLHEGHYVLGRNSSRLGMRLFVRLPQWLRLALMRMFFLSRPRRLAAAMGTVMITTVSMAGRAKGWIIPVSVHPLCLALGAITRQPALGQGEPEERQILCLTVLIDHDVVDGVPAAQFVDELLTRIHTCHGL